MYKVTYQDLKRQSELGAINYCAGCKLDLPLTKFEVSSYNKIVNGKKVMCIKCRRDKPFSKAIKAKSGTKRHARAVRHQEKMDTKKSRTKALVNERNLGNVKWSNKDIIALTYAECTRLEKETGIKYHVDHSVPLKAIMASGLHNEFNLQILSASDNISKNNRFIPTHNGVEVEEKYYKELYTELSKGRVRRNADISYESKAKVLDISDIKYIQITKEIIMAGTKGNFGSSVNKKQVKLLGLPTIKGNLEKGWVDNLLSKEFPDFIVNEFIKLRR